MKPIVIEPAEAPEACIIWMHGLGAGADDMAGLAKQLPLTVPIRHISVNAPIRPVTLNQGMPMPAWYDITGMSLTDREDKAGILDSEQTILNILDEQIAAGMAPARIFLAGFSQGGAMALFTALQSQLALGGVMALSAYLPLADVCQAHLSKTTPLFIASGRLDEVVLPDWTAKTVRWLQARGFDAITVRDYQMAHAVCIEEVQDMAVWLKAQI